MKEAAISNISAPQRHPDDALAVFSYGFRPFFLVGPLWAVIGVLLWMPQYFGELSLPNVFSPLEWHIHEMIFGYVAAVLAGFLLTAIPNWTGRLPVKGYPLAALVALWLAGRIAIVCSVVLGAPIAAVIDVAFLVVLAAVAMREIAAGKNWRNLRVLGVLGVLIAANIVFHAEAFWRPNVDYGTRLGIAAVVLLITLIAGRIVPSFTHNWLMKNNPGRLPRPFSRFDALVLAVSVAALAGWVALPQSALSGGLLMTAGVLQAVRLARWAGDRTLADRLVLILHLAYAFVPLGFLFLGAAILWPSFWPASAGIHAWTTGAVGLMTLAVMTRAILGHTGWKLAASTSTQVIYLCAFAAALVRVLAAFEPSSALLHVAAFAWFAAFGGFVAAFAPILLGRPVTPH